MTDANSRRNTHVIEITPEDKLLAYNPARPDQAEHFVITGILLNLQYYTQIIVHIMMNYQKSQVRILQF